MTVNSRHLPFCKGTLNVIKAIQNGLYFFMDIYTQKSRWKWYLGVAGALIVLLSAFFTIYLTSKLSEEERNKLDLLSESLERIVNYPEDADLTLHNAMMAANTTVPIMIYDYESDVIVDAVNFGKAFEGDDSYFRSRLKKLQSSDADFLEIEDFSTKMYYEQSRILTLLQYFPLVQVLLISAFIGFGYFSFSNARRAEQNRVWAGMAKETAHQLGTPISAILGWIDHLKMTKEDDEEVLEVMDELMTDVNRLELVADRFSKIGSAPELKSINIYEELAKAQKYMQRRAPRKVEFLFPDVSTHGHQNAMINSHLFAWVVENLLRNALDAMGNKGIISANVYEEGNFVNVDISDTGKGIPASKWKTVFQPGYSTKKRGWGLGLSLAKRIIEEYHAGKIYVKESKSGIGTTFTIKLPKA